MYAFSADLVLEGMSLVFLGIAVHRLVLSAGFHNTKYLGLGDAGSSRSALIGLTESGDDEDNVARKSLPTLRQHALA